MAAEKGRAFLLKAGAVTLAGLRSTSISINNEAVDITNKDDAAWRTLLATAGIRSVSISASGVFLDDAALITTQGYALAGTLNAFEILFESGDNFDGSFLVTSLEYAGEYNGERTYSLTLESSGAVTFTAV